MCLGFFDKKRVFQWNWWLIGWRPNTNVKVHELGWSGSRGVVPYITLTLVGGVPPQQIQGAPAANPLKKKKQTTRARIEPVTSSLNSGPRAVYVGPAIQVGNEARCRYATGPVVRNKE